MAKEDITREGTVEKFFKAYASVAVGKDAKALFVNRFNELAEVVVQKAIVESKLENEAVPQVTAKHVEKALEGLGWSTGGGGGGLDPAGILQRLHQMPPEQIAEVVRLLRSWLATQTR